MDKGEKGRAPREGDYGGKYKIHGCAENVDEVLVYDCRRGGQEEVGNGYVEDGEGADDGGRGDRSHGGGEV